MSSTFPLKGKKIIIGVTGSIAAYKSAELVRLLVKEGTMVRVVMTCSATTFISPLTLSVLSKSDVISEINANEHWNNHVELGLWADLMIIAPCTANTLSKMANGLCDNMLLATYLSAKCPVVVAPAMDLDMYKHPSTKQNINTLVKYKNHVLNAPKGELASGLHGEGRMQEPSDIVAWASSFLSGKQLFKNKHFLITAGPTYEAIDPVRYIGNHSSGKMGFALAEEAAKQGAKVTLISGPVALEIQHPNIQRIDVVSADQMFKACKKHFKKADVLIKSAAVADFKPQVAKTNKIKTKKNLTITLDENQDILKYLGTKKTKKQFIVGFALESQSGETFAKEKIKKKNLDLIVLNSLKDKGAGFGHNTNKVTLIDSSFKSKKLPLMAKSKVAKYILSAISDCIL